MKLSIFNIFLPILRNYGVCHWTLIESSSTLCWEETALVICALQFLRIMVIANGCCVGNVKCTIIWPWKTVEECGKKSAYWCRKSKRQGPWVGKIPWRRNGNLLQYSHLENPMNRGAWQATVHGVRVRHNWVTEHMYIWRWKVVFSFFPNEVKEDQKG